MIVDQDFIDQYTKLLIMQYYDKPKAKAEIEGVAGEFSKVYGFFSAFMNEFDLDDATGDRLDIIGNIVGFNRIVPNSLAKYFFGFDGDSTAKGFDDLFSIVDSAPLKDLFALDYTDTQLSDNDYRTFIRAKIAKNIVKAYMVSDGQDSIQDITPLIFGDMAYVLDNYNMSMTLYLPFNFDSDILKVAQESGLIPHAQGVGYKYVSGKFDSFGFESDPNALGFGDLSDDLVGGSFAEIYS